MSVLSSIEDGQGKHGCYCEASAYQRLSIAVLLCLCHLVSYADRFNISVAILHMSKEYGYTATQQGHIFAAFFVGYIMTQTLGGILSSPGSMAVGPKFVLVGSCATWSLVAISTPACADYSLSMLFASRILLGAVEGLYIPACVALIAAWFPAHERSSVTALSFVGMCLGATSAMACAPFAAHNWRMLFYGFGALGLLWSGAFMVFGSDGPNSARHLRTYGVAEQRSKEMDVQQASYMQILRCPAFWSVAASHAAYNWSWYLTLSWLPRYFVQVWNFSEAAVGGQAMRPYAAAAIFSVLWAKATDSILLRGSLSLWHVRLYSQIVSAMVPISIWTTLILTSGAGPLWAAGLLTLAVSAQTAGQSGFQPNIIDISGPENAGRVAALSNTFATLPGIFGNVLVGFLLSGEGGWSAVFLTMIVAQALGLAVFTTCGQAVPMEF